jgi:predicted amidohydrolase YtcJ
LIDGRHIQRVGAGEPPGADRIVNLPGATITPGFIDAHVHLTPTGLDLLHRDTASVRSRGELLERARERAAETQEGSRCIYLQGFDESTWEDPELPSIADLDAVTDRPLLIRRADTHTSLANTALLKAAALPDAAAGVERDADGSWTGRLTRGANDLAGRWALDGLTEHELQNLQLAAASAAASTGVTTVQELSMPHWLGLRDLDVFLRQRDRLPVDAIPIVATTDLGVAIDRGLHAIGGDLPTDGSIGARTAALATPYADGTGAPTPLMGDADLFTFFSGGHGAGLQVGVHAIGDAAIEQVLTAWETVYRNLDSRARRHFRARRHRIEHFEMASEHQIERAAMLGLAISVQPTFDRKWGHPGGLYHRALGGRRAGGMNRFRTMVLRGLEVGAGSDSPVTPLGPLLAVRSLQEHHDPQERFTRSEAVRIHTIGSARLAHLEGKKGSLAPGMHADLVAWDADPLEVDEPYEPTPALVVSLGREVFAS